MMRKLIETQSCIPEKKETKYIYETFHPDIINAQTTPLDFSISLMKKNCNSFWNASYDPGMYNKTKFYCQNADDNEDAVDWYYKFLSEIITLQMLMISDFTFDTRGYYFDDAGIKDKFGFHEYIYGFLDANDNLCLITDGYLDKHSLGNKAFDNAKFDFKIYQNWDKETKVDIIGAKEIFRYHRRYVAIIRFPKSKWIKQYTHSFWRYYIQYFFKNLCIQEQKTKSDTERQHLIDTMKFGHRFIPSRSYGNINWSLAAIPSLSNNYSTVASQFICGYSNKVSISLFAVTYHEYQRKLIENIVQQSCVRCVYTIIMDYICNVFEQHPIPPNYSNHWDFSLLRNSEMNNLEKEGVFLLNPYKYKFLFDEELQTLKEIILKKFPIPENYDYQDLDDDIERGYPKWTDIESFNDAIEQHLWVDFSKGSYWPTESKPFLIKEEIMGFTCTTDE